MLTIVRRHGDRLALPAASGILTTLSVAARYRANRNRHCLILRLSVYDFLLCFIYRTTVVVQLKSAVTARHNR